MKAVISNNIRVLRSFLKLTQTGFAKKFGTTRGSLMSWERGRGRVTPEFMNAVCNYFGITNEQLMKQKLTEEDLQPTGSAKSAAEVKLEEALKRIDLLEKTIKDKEEIIELLRGKRP